MANNENDKEPSKDSAKNGINVGDSARGQQVGFDE